MKWFVASSIGPIVARTSARPLRSSASPTSTGIIESWLPLFPLTKLYDRDRDATGRFEE